AGPRHLHRPRLAETVVSMTSVGADGTIARTADGLSPALAGRELPRLLTGPWGTRAIIVAAEIELSMRPAAQQFVWIPGAEAAAALLGARQPPAAVVIERPPGSSPATVARAVGEGDAVAPVSGRLRHRSPAASLRQRPAWWSRRARGPVPLTASADPDFVPRHPGPPAPPVRSLTERG